MSAIFVLLEIASFGRIEIMQESSKMILAKKMALPFSLIIGEAIFLYYRKLEFKYRGK